MNELGEVQAQVMALRLAVEGIWMSLLQSGPDALVHARRLQQENVAAIGQLDASNPQAKAMRDAVAMHTEHLWGSIAWQLEQVGKAG